MTTTPADYCQLWRRPQDAVAREADVKAFDKLPTVLREIVNEAPIAVACTLLLQGFRKFGAEAMAAELRGELAEWQRSFAANPAGSAG